MQTMKTLIRSIVFLILLAGAAADWPRGAGAAPAPQGNYVSGASMPHPFVFAAPAEYRALLTSRTIIVTSRTAITDKALSRLQGLVTDELRQGADYTATYSGCELDTHLSSVTCHTSRNSVGA
jgi:hypothetical protein